MDFVQQDFLCLTVPRQTSLDTIEDHHDLMLRSICSSSPEAMCQIKSISALYIDSEVTKLIEHWGVSACIKQKDAPKSENAHNSPYDPVRLCDTSSPPPPKRFYRTFWRSLTRRYVQATSCK